MSNTWGGGTERLRQDGDHVATFRQFRLDVVEGPDAGQFYVSTAARAAVGSDARADFVLHDPAVSRFHCEIEIMEKAAVLRDLSSSNGTRLAGVEILAAPISSGAAITVGRSKLIFSAGEARVEVPLFAGTQFGSLIGLSGVMRAAFGLLERAAKADSTVLLLGETGVGKDLAAESIHQQSARRDRPFVEVDCRAIPANLLESELFGTASRPGSFEAASGGTLFLDEIGELPLDLQAQVLAAIERREVRRIGSTTAVPIDVRVISATHRNLRVEVNAGRFRPALYLALGVIEVTLPPLRDRSEDLPPLVEHFLAAMGASHLPVADQFRTPAFYTELARHSWPGNVRELRQHIERCLVFEAPALLQSSSTDDDEGPVIDPKVPLSVARLRWSNDFERRYLVALLKEHGNNVTVAARAAGVARVHLHRLLARSGLR